MAGKKSLADTITSVLLKEDNKPQSVPAKTSNANTLKAGSEYKEEMHVLPKGKVPKIEDDEDVEPSAIPDAKKGTMNGGPKVIANAKKDHSKSSIPALGPEPMHKLEKQPASPVNEDDLPEEIDLDALIEAMAEDGLTEDQIEESIASLLEDYDIVEEDGEEINEDEEVDEDEEIVSEPVELPTKIEVGDVSEDIKAMFEGETFSEEFKEKASLIFTTALQTRLDQYQDQLDEAFNQAIIESTDEIQQAISENVEDYMNYVVEQWVEENEVALESRLKTELTEDFIVGLKNLFMEHYIDIPEEETDVVEQLSAKVAELETKLDEEIATNVELSKLVTEAAKNEILVDLTQGLTATQAEKLASLAENVEFNGEKDFVEKVNTLRESYFPKAGKIIPSTLEKEIVVDGEKQIIAEESNRMNKYADYIGKSIPASARPVQQ